MEMFIGFVLGVFALLFLICLLDNTDAAIGNLEEQVKEKDALIDSLTAERKVMRQRLAVALLRRRSVDVSEIVAYWPTLEGVEDGVDVFWERYGEPTGAKE